MMDRKKIDGRKYLLVFILTTILFLAGIGTGAYFSTTKLTELKNLQENFRAETFDLEVQYSLVEKEPCKYVNSSILTENLYDLSVKLEYMENLLGKDDEEVIKLKNYYQLLEIRQWLFEKSLSERCDADKYLILYFYSNAEGKCKECNDQGFILSYLRKKYGENVEVFSFDSNIESESMKTIKSKYRISMTPSIVINEKLYEGFQSKDALEGYLTQETSANNQNN
jgi:hypothetical protein